MLPERLNGVLAVVYLVFTEGWAGGANPTLAGDAIQLGRVLSALMPDSDEVRGLLALMLFQHSRRDARTVDGQLITLERQDRSRWDTGAIVEGLALLAVPAGERGSYRIQAELAAVHADTRQADDTYWPAIVTLYTELHELQPSPVVSLNRAVAIGMADGALAGLAELDSLTSDPTLQRYHLLYAARGEFLSRAGLKHEAVAELVRAAALAPTERERNQLDQRRAELS
jgi:RNA polymerase sigma-70 factor (ECF subfamily)